VELAINITLVLIVVLAVVAALGWAMDRSGDR
jgi:hypothetical protein